jgi:aspartate aminotransferase
MIQRGFTMATTIEERPQLAISNLNRARKVLAGIDEKGEISHPDQFSEQVISFADGEGMRRPYPEVVVSGMEALLETDITSLEKYFFLDRYNPLDEKISSMFVKEGIQLDMSKNICISTGTSHLFNAFFNSLKLNRNIVLTAPGFYHSLANWCELNNGILEVVQTERFNQYKITKKDLLNWVKENNTVPTALVIFNPTYTGAIYTKEELAGIAEFVNKFNVSVVEDSLFMYTKYMKEEEIYHLASNLGVKTNLVTIHGASKSYGLANLRIGWACGTSEIINKMNFYVGATQVDAPHVAKVMALRALDAPTWYLEANNNELLGRVELIKRLINETNEAIKGVSPEDIGFNPILELIYQPAAGHSLLISFNNLMGLKTEYGTVLKDSIDITKYFLQKGNVALSPGLSMGFTDATMRISFGCVGLEQSYASSRDIEKVLFLKEALYKNGLSSEFKNLLDIINKEEDYLFIDYNNHQENAFLKGREIIIEGFGRIKEALLSLIEFNIKEHKQREVIL